MFSSALSWGMKEAVSRALNFKRDLRSLFRLSWRVSRCFGYLSSCSDALRRRKKLAFHVPHYKGCLANKLERESERERGDVVHIVLPLTNEHLAWATGLKGNVGCLRSPNNFRFSGRRQWL